MFHVKHQFTHFADAKNTHVDPTGLAWLAWFLFRPIGPIRVENNAKIVCNFLAWY